MSNAMVYLSSVSTGDAPEGMLARVLKHNVSGVRYYPPPKPSKPKRRSMPSVNTPHSERGYQINRDFAAKQKGRAA